MEKEKTIYDLELHEEIKIRVNNSTVWIIKVPGGWIYQIPGEQELSGVFVPDTRS